MPATEETRFRRRLLWIELAVLAFLLLIIGPQVSARMGGQEQEVPAAETDSTATATTTPILLPATLTPAAPTQDLAALPSVEIALPLPPLEPAARSAISPLGDGLIIVSLAEEGYQRLFAYSPQSTPLIRLYAGPWNDITPAINPDGTQLAFASDRDGPYDLYVLDIASGVTTRLTQTPEWEASPSWSPDGKWLAYETLLTPPEAITPAEPPASSRSPSPTPLPPLEERGNLEIFVRPLDGSQEPIRMTESPSADYSPVWSPLGRQIAFVSDRSGDAEIWLADLDQIDERFINLSRSVTTAEARPAWSPDGTRLSWTSNGPASNGVSASPALYIWDSARPDGRPREVGSGDWSAWNPRGDILLTSILAPNRAYITAYSPSEGALILPLLPLPGALTGLAWGRLPLPSPLPDVLALAAAFTPVPEWAPVITPDAGLPFDRRLIALLNDVIAPNAALQDMVDESYNALRRRVAQETGWDFLASLENAFVTLTQPLGPGQMEDWLYTGRAFAFNTAPMNAGWLVVAREDFGSITYWRIFLKTRFQDGSQGQPLHMLPWDFSARFAGDPRFYEQGGAFARQVSGGYWIDFTALAAAYGWERLPATSSWRMSYSAARFNEFVLADGRDWMAAMLEIYPKEALDTPTPVPPPTDTPTITPWPSRTPAPTRTPYMTRTPLPTSTPWPTRTPLPTNTPKPTATATPPG